VINIVRADRINLKQINMTDPIADYLTRLRNAIRAGHRVVEIPASNLKKEITKILLEKGYILNFKFVEEGPQGSIKIALSMTLCTRSMQSNNSCVSRLRVYVSM
jgi:ribosomal protein S8